MITCQICNQEYCSVKNLSAHLRVHINDNIIESTKEYYIKYIDSRTKCLKCENDVSYRGLKQGFLLHCSHKCAANDSLIKRKMIEGQKKTLITKYGVDHISKIEGFSEKVKNTKLKKYGCEGYNNQPAIVASCKNRFGVNYASQSLEIKKKVKDTCVKNLGVACSLNTKNGIEKFKKTNLKKYGFEYPLQNEAFLKKCLETKAERGCYRKRLFCNVTVQSKLEELFVLSQINEGNIIEDGPVIEYFLNGKKHFYFVDFIVKTKTGSRLVEVKAKHKWYYNEIKTGKLLSKVRAAQKYSKNIGFLPFKMWFGK